MKHVLPAWRNAALFVGFVSVGLTAALWPRPALAACGALDLGACVDAVEYSGYYGVAGMAWSIDRVLLQLAYQLTQFRAYLVETAFTSAYAALTGFLTPAYAPIATVALLLACVLFMLVPLSGNRALLPIRHVLIWVVLTPLLLTVGGQLIGQAEQIRAQIGSALFVQAAAGAPGAIFGTTASDMPAPQPLYPSNPCGTGTLSRPDGDGMHMDDLAAALLYANAQDIHCPDFAGPSPDIPDAFYATPPGYAFDGYLGNLDSEVERRAAVEGMQRGMTRLFQGILPSLLAVAEALLNVLFSLSLLTLWLGIPLGLLFVYFQPTTNGVSSLFRRAIAVFQVSWSSSIVIGLLFACLLAATRLGNATAYTGFAIGSLLLTTYLCVVAGKTLVQSVQTLSATVQSATGLSVTGPIEVTTAAGAAAGAAALGLAAGGAGLAVAGAAASEGTRRNSYMLATMAGRLPGIAPVGEVLATMGWLDTEGALFSGLTAGERSTHSWRSMRLQVRRDDARFTAERAAARAAKAEVTTPIDMPPPAELELERLDDQARRLLLAAERATARQNPVLRASAMHLDDAHQIVYTERANPTALAGLRAITVPRGEANIPRLLVEGYRVQENPSEATVSYWRPGTPASQPAPPAAAGQGNSAQQTLATASTPGATQASTTSEPVDTSAAATDRPNSPKPASPSNDAQAAVTGTGNDTKPLQPAKTAAPLQPAAEAAEAAPSAQPQPSRTQRAQAASPAPVEATEQTQPGTAVPATPTNTPAQAANQQPEGGDDS